MRSSASRHAEPSTSHAKRVLSVLSGQYPNARIGLNYSNPWELLVAVILSAQCRDTRVNQVTTTLFAKYTTVDDYAKADRLQLEQDIRPTGFYRSKAKHILQAAQMVRDVYRGKVPDSMDALLTLPGVARKTANVVLGNAFGKVGGIAVDTHVVRLSQRLRLVNPQAVGGKKTRTFVHPTKGRAVDFTKDADPVKIEEELMKTIPKKSWFAVTYLLIDHGRAVCKAQSPDCSSCVLSPICPSSRLG